MDTSGSSGYLIVVVVVAVVAAVSSGNSCSARVAVVIVDDTDSGNTYAHTENSVLVLAHHIDTEGVHAYSAARC
eukprot:20937-Heterococcus_DN1.PRE.1